MILYGASGHGKVVYSICSSKVSCFVDDNNLIKTFSNIPVVSYEDLPDDNEKIILCIGDNINRKKVSIRVHHPFDNVISKYAVVDNTVVLGFGNQIIHRSLIQADVKIGSHCIINSMSSVDHDCILGDFVHIAPSATLCGNVVIGEGSFIGAGAVILPNLKIGEWSIIGSGSVVTKDIPDNAVVIGNPARILKTNGTE